MKNYCIKLLGLLLFLISNPVLSQSFNELKRISHNGANHEKFGESVDLFDTTGIIGYPGFAGGTTNEGAVSIIIKNQGGKNNWGQVIRLIPNDPSLNKEFGKSVAIYSNLAIVGAPGDTTNGTNSGSAYIFERNTGGVNNWGQVAKLTASDADTFDLFGSSVSIFENYVSIGAMCNKDSGECSGAVYIYYKDFGGLNNWGEVKKVTASDGKTTDYFGYSVSMDSSTLAVGAIEGKGIDTIPTGAVYVYHKNQGGGNNWGEITKILSSDIDTNDAFGASVFLSNDTLAVGAPEKDEVSFPQSGAAYLFYKNQGGGNNWGELQKLSPSIQNTANRFGTSVAFDRNYMLIGTDGDSTNGMEAGSIYLFEKKTTWQLNKLIFSSDLVSQDNFGHSVSVHKQFGLVGAYNKSDAGLNAGAAYVFVENNNPHVSGINDTVFCENDPISLSFKLTDIETSFNGISIIKNSTNLSLVDTSNIIITGVDSNKTVTIIPASNLSGSSNISFIAVDTLNGMDTLSFVLTINPVDSNSVSRTICFGDSILFGGSYLSVSGVYNYIYTNKYGCDSVVELALTVDTALLDVSISASQDSICFGTNITFNSNVTNGGTPFYNWYVNSTLQVISSSFNTSVLTNKDTVYCIVTSSLSCATPNPDTSNKIVVNVFNQTLDSVYDTICSGGFIIIEGNLYDSAGVFHDTLSSTFGCDSIIVVFIIENPTDTTNLYTAICMGDSLLFGGNCLKGGGTYSDTLKNQYNCDSIIFLELTVEDTSLFVLAYAVDSNICPNDSLSLYATTSSNVTSANYFWRRNGSVVSGDSNYIFPSNLASSGDIFTVEVFANSFCYSNKFAISDTLQLTQRADTYLDIYDTVCDGLGYSFGGQVLTVSGTYHDTADASTFCDSITTLYLVVYPTPIAPNITQSNDTLRTDNWFSNYQWIHNGVPIPLANDSIHITSVSGTYRVEVVDTNGCAILSYPWNFIPIGIENLVNGRDIKLFPNPVFDVLYIKIPSEYSSELVVNVFDIAGKKKQVSYDLKGNNTTINTSNLEPGTYFVEISGAQKKFPKLFIKN